jgi:hypothetical protein
MGIRGFPRNLESRCSGWNEAVDCGSKSSPCDWPHVLTQRAMLFAL